MVDGHAATATACDGTSAPAPQPPIDAVMESYKKDARNSCQEVIKSCYTPSFTHRHHHQFPYPPVPSKRVVTPEMTTLTPLNKISIAQLIIYTPALMIAIILSIRHGYTRSSGWIYLTIFSLARILGAALQLATIAHPTDISLLVGATTLQSIGLSPLILCMLGLLSRVLDSIRRSKDTLITPRHIRLVQVLVIVGLILGVVGGSMMGDVIAAALENGSMDYDVPAETRAGLGVMVAGFGILVVASLMSCLEVRAAEEGEKRLLLAIGLAMPFVLVRLVFAAMATFGDDRDFRGFGGTGRYPDYLLGMAVVMEMVAVAILEGVGLTLRKAGRVVEGERVEMTTGRGRRRWGKGETDVGVQGV